MTTAARLLEALAQFYFRAKNAWCASGKSIIRYLHEDNPVLAEVFSKAFEHVFQTGETTALKSLVQKILEPYGGLLWDGFKSEAFNLYDKNSMERQINQLELSLLQPSVRKSHEQLNQLLADNFIEFGSSGTAYNKKDILALLPIEESKNYLVENFKTMELSEGIILATYQVTYESQPSLRSSIWKLHGGTWQMVFHQGTPCKKKGNLL